jgi:putative MATE family efflux protein
VWPDENIVRAIGYLMADVMSDVLPRSRSLFVSLILLSIPVFAEHALHVVVGITDTYLANHLVPTTGVSGAALDAAHATNAAAGAAVGSIAYVLWFLGLVVAGIGTGATAIIARATGSRHKRLANQVAGQAILCAMISGLVLGVMLYCCAGPIAQVAHLPADATEYFQQYVRILSFGIPFAVVMFTANACLRGSGDTITPAVAMMTVDGVNFVLSVGLTYGMFYLPKLGFSGIAIGTCAAYIAGGVLQLIVLAWGRKNLKLYLHRLKPQWITIKRILRIGIPAGSEGIVWWIANFAVLSVVNTLGSVSATAHNLAIRVESFSFMSGFAVATAVATLVGQRLGAGKPDEARRAAWLGYAFGGGIMTSIGLTFILFSAQWASLFTDDPAVQSMTAQCLFATGFIQCGMAAAITFGSALRGAGDTVAAMLASLSSVIIFRCAAVLVAGYIGFTLGQIWIILSAELFIRGMLMMSRFMSGKWVHAKV